MSFRASYPTPNRNPPVPVFVDVTGPEDPKPVPVSVPQPKKQESEPERFVEKIVEIPMFKITPIEQPKESIEDLYDQLEQAEVDEDKGIASIDNLIIEVKKQEAELVVFQRNLLKNNTILKRLQTKQSTFKQCKQEILTKIRVEKDRINKCHQETLDKLREKNRILVENLKKKEDELKNAPVVRIPVLIKTPDIKTVSLAKEERHIVETPKETTVPLPIFVPKNDYQKSLLTHMTQFKSDPWFNLFLNVFAYDPENPDISLNYINNFATDPVCIPHREKTKLWLSKNQASIRTVIKNKYTFLDFAITLRNVIHKFKNEHPVTKQDIFKFYNISI